jgi:hypothetical protein
VPIVLKACWSLLLPVGFLALTGCMPSPAHEAAASRESLLTSADVATPPKELVDAVKRAVAAPPLSVPVEQQEKGILVTGWKRYRGDWHIGRYWQERTRYRIIIAPDWDEPTAKSRLTVLAETEQRAAEGQRWDREPRIPRPRRAEAALRAVLEQVQRPAGT